MAKYKCEIVKNIKKSFNVTVPNGIPEEDIQQWVKENVFNVGTWRGEVLWCVDDLVEGKKTNVSIECTFEDYDYDLEEFTLEA